MLSMGKSTISMAIFNSYVSHNQRVFKDRDRWHLGSPPKWLVYWYTYPFENIWKSVGMMTFPNIWKKNMFQNSKPSTSIYIYNYIYILTMMIDSPHSPPHFPFSPPSEWKPPARGWWCKPQSPPGSAANARPPWRARFLQRLKFNRWLGGHGGATAFQMGEVVENLLCPSHENTASSHVEKNMFQIHFKNHVSDRFWVLAAFFHHRHRYRHTSLSTGCEWDTPKHPKTR